MKKYVIYGCHSEVNKVVNQLFDRDLVIFSRRTPLNEVKRTFEPMDDMEKSIKPDRVSR